MIRHRFTLALVAAASLAVAACGSNAARPTSAGATAPPVLRPSTAERAVAIVAASAPTIERVTVRYRAARRAAAPVVAVMSPERAALVTAIADRVDRALELAQRASTAAARAKALTRAEAAIGDLEAEGGGG